MAFEDSLIGNDDFDPKIATESLAREVTKEPLPDYLEPHMLNTRLAKKLNEKPGRIDYGVEPKQPTVNVNPNDVDAGEPFNVPETAQPTAGVQPPPTQPSPDTPAVKVNPNDSFVNPADAAKAAETKPAGTTPNTVQSTGIGGDIDKALRVGIHTAAADLHELWGYVPVVGKYAQKGADVATSYFRPDVKGAQELFKKSIDELHKSQTPEQQAGGSKKWVKEATPLKDDFSNFSEYAKGLSPGDAWSDPRAYLGGVVESLPEQAVTMVPGMALAKYAYTARVAAGVAKEVAAKAAARVATLAGMLSEGALGGAQTSREVRDKVLELPPETLAQSDAYKALLATGLKPEDAKLALADNLATRAFVTSGVVTGLFGGMGDRAIVKIFTEGGNKGLIRRVLAGFGKGAVGEGPFEEFPQSVGQQIAQNEALKQANPEQSLFEDVLNQGVGGMAIGALQGGGMGAVSGASSRGHAPAAAPAQPPYTGAQPPPIPPGTPPAAGGPAVPPPGAAPGGAGGPIQPTGTTGSPPAQPPAPAAPAPPPATTTPAPVNVSSPEQYAMLREMGWDHEDIASMSPKQLTHQEEDAKELGINPVEAMKKFPLPQQPAAEAPKTKAGESPQSDLGGQPAPAAAPAAPAAAAGPTVVTNPADQPAAPAGEDTTGLRAMGAGMAGGMAEGLHDRLWDKIQKGETEDLGKPDPLLQAAKMARAGGGLQTREQYQAFAQDYGNIEGTKGPEFQRKMRELVQKHSTPAPQDNVQGGAGAVPIEGAKKPASSGPIKAEEAGRRPLTEAPEGGSNVPKGAPPAGVAGRPESIIPETHEGSVQKLTQQEELPVDKADVRATAEHHTQIDQALGPDAGSVLPVDANRAAQILAENPDMPPGTAFGQAVAENAVEQGYLTEPEAEEIYGPHIKEVLDAGRGVTPEGGGKPEGEGAKPEQGAKVDTHEAGVVPRGGEAGEAAADKAAGTEPKHDTTGGKPDTEREAGGAADHAEVAADIQAAEAADTVEGYLDHIQGEIDRGNYDAGLAPTKSLKEFREAAEKRGWTQDAYGKGTALWSPDRESVMFTSVAVKGNNVQVQWSKPGKEIAKPGAEKTKAEATVERGRKAAEKVNEREAEREKEAFARLEDERQQAELNAPTWAQILAALPMHPAGNRKDIQIAFDAMKEITGKNKKLNFEKLTPAQKTELLERLQAKPAEAPERDSAWALQQRAKSKPKNDNNVTEALQLADQIEAAGGSAAYVDGIRSVVANGTTIDGKALEHYREKLKELAPARDEISDIWDDILGPEAAEAPAQAAPAKTGVVSEPRTAGQAGKAAATKISTGAMEALKGLDALFSPKGKLGAGPTFDDETYAKAKPFFKKAAEEFAGAWTDMKEFAQLLAKAMQDHMGWTMDRLRQLRPYLEQFTRDVRDGIVKFAKGAADERAGTEVAGEKALDQVPPAEGGGVEGAGPVERGTERGGEPRAGRDRGAAEEGVPGARGEGSGAAATDTAAAGAGGRRRAGPRARREGGGVSEESAAASRITPADGPNIPATNFHITDELGLGQGSEAVKFRDNVAAIENVNRILGENRRATPDEQKILARYVGWGGLANAFRDSEGNFKEEWRARGEELERLLSPEELRMARASTRNAHYTSKAVVDATWKAVTQLGFKGGLVLEPSAGSGNFLGLIPQDIAGASKFMAVEYDPTTARIAKLLYPNETVLHSAFQQVPLANGEFTLAIGNPPFGNESLRFQYNPAVTGHSIHNQFFLASLDALRPGGIQAMVVSRYLMDAQDPKAREAIALKAELLGAIRLPDTAFKENARTQVVTDIVFLRRRTAAEEERLTKAMDEAKKAGKNLPWEMEWTQTTQVRDPLGGEPMHVNKYFAKHSNRSMIVGQLERSGSMYGNKPEVNVTLAKGADFEAMLNDAVERLPKNMLDTTQEVLDGTAARHKAMSEALDIALEGHEPGHVTFSPDGKMLQVIERETPSGSFEATRRVVTPESPWSRALIQDKDGNWYSMEAAVDEKGQKQKQGKRNVYVRKYYPDNKVPGSMRLGDVKFKRLGQLVGLRDLTKRQLVLEAEDAPEAAMEANRAKLAAAYNAFVAEHGLINDPANLRLANDLPDGALIASLESGYREAITTTKASKTGQTARPATAKPAAIMSRRVVMKYETPTTADSPADALSITLSEMGRADMDRIADLLGKTPQEATAIMTEGDNPLLYRDPETQSYEPPNTYLSGNVARKLKAAQAAGMDKNVAALQKVQPERWTAENVTAIIGSNWIPPKVYQDFADHLFGGKAYVSYSPATNAFALNMQGRPDRAKYETWSTKEKTADEILAGMLNSRVPKVMTEDAEGNKRVDQEASALVAQKAREIETEFADWVFQDNARRNQLVDIYNDKFNTKVTRQHDGSHLTLPGKVPDQVIKLRRHQLNAVWRGIYEKTMLLDHVVGAGKTFTAIARAMERRRMGLSQKPTIVVPNHLVDQWASDVYRLYPAAKVLAAGKNQFDSKNRRRLFAKIATGDWDIVIVPHSSFGFIGIAPETEQRFLETEFRLAEQAIKDAEAEAAEQGVGGGRMKPFTVKQAEALRDKLRNKMDRLKQPKERMLTFEQMGIDDLTVDEAHEFKNLFYSSRLTGVSGMGNPAGSEKAFDLYNKIRALRENPNGTVTFMTGTPISNSAVEMYTMMRYLMPEELKELGLEHFDAWRTQSVSAQAKYEPTAAGGLKEVTRLGRTWSNMRSLMELYYGFTDSVSQADINKAYAEDNNGARFPVPKVKGGGRKEVVAKPTPEQSRILTQVVADFNSLPSISDPIQRNAERLRLMDRARKVSLDARAVDPTLPTTEAGGKLEQIATNVVRIYNESTKDLGTQLVFLDRSVPKAKGDDKLLKAYDELVKRRDAAEASGDETAYRTAIEGLDKFDLNEIEAMRAAQAGGWNAYDQLKQNLIAQGIPAKEIRFVQEATNDLEKKALFDSVNSGETRVLIGSTPRMGAGTNVQERLVGLHHADVTWKPSDIEQREGRIIRQGNELLQKYGADNFEAEILAYVTERTVDAKMWDLNSTKLRMINGIRNYDGSFNMEFADEDAVGMAEIAALASGDPMLMERVKLQSEIEKVELQERAHRRKQFGIKDTIEALEDATKSYPARIERGQAEAKQAQAGLDEMNAAVAARTVEFNGTTYTHEQKDEAQAAIQAAIDEQQAGDKTAKYLVMVGGRRVTSQEALTDVLSDTLGDKVPIEAVIDGKAMGSRAKIAKTLTETMQGAYGSKNVGTMAGYDLVVGKEAMENGNYTLSMTLQRDGKTVVDEERAAKQVEVAPVRALFDKVYGELKDAAAFTGKWMQDKINEAQERLPNLLAQRGKPFAEAEKLKGLRDRLNEVTSILDARTKEAEGQTRQASDDDEDVERATVSVAGTEAFTPEERADIENMVRKAVKNLIGDAVRVEFSDNIELGEEAAEQWGQTVGRGTPKFVAGKYSSGNKLIQLSLLTEHLESNLAHEIYHAIEYQLQTDQERRLMEKETPRIREAVRDYTAKKYGLTGEAFDAIKDDEIRAIGFEKFVMDDITGVHTPVHVGVKRWYHKLLTLLRRIKNGLLGRGFKTYEDVYGKGREGGYRDALNRSGPETGRGMIGPLQPAETVADRLMREFMAPPKPKPQQPPAKPGVERASIGPAGRQGPPVLAETIEAQLRARAYTKLADIAKRTGIGSINTVDWRTNIQDKFIRIFNVEKSANNYNAALSAYQAESLSHGRKGERLEDLEKRSLDPLIKEMHDAGISLGEMNAFLYARHAPERNAYIDTINPGLNGEGSGMSNAEAAAIMNSIDPAKIQEFDRIATMVDGIQAQTRANLVAYGLISQQTADAWEAQYPNYVPLRGFEEASENDTNSPMSGVGLDQRAQVTKTALGRSSMAEGPLQNIMMQAESAIVRGENNRVGNTFLRFVRANPDPARWGVDTPLLKRGIDPKTGMVTYYADFRAHNDPDAFVTRVGGKPVVIRLHGRDGANIARALKGMDSVGQNAIMRGLQMITTTMARLHTQWNPEFVLSNFIRDMGEAFINLGEQAQQGFRANFAKHLGPSLKGIMQELRNPGSAGAYSAAFREFDKAGGRVRFFGLSDPSDIAASITRKMRRMEGGVFNNVMSAAAATGHTIEAVNSAIENATRLAAYMAAREANMTIPEAAMLARNLTVDFNKKGEWGSAITTLYMFGNARIQGTARLGRALQHKKVRRAAYALAGMGALSAVYSILAGGDDDDGESYYTKIPSWVRDKNMIIMWPKGWGHDGAYIKIPVPFGFAPFYTLGARAAAVAMGKDKVTDAAWGLLSSAADAFNPVGEESSLLAQLIPSLARPIYHIGTNLNWTGKPLYPDKDYNKQAPDSTKAFRSTSEASKWVAETLNAVTGGSKYKAGWVDVHPGTLDHLMETVTGGVGRFAAGMVKTGAMALNGEFDPAKSPVLRRFTGTASDPISDAAAYYAARDEAAKSGGVNVRAARKDMGKPEERAAAEAYLRDNPKAAQADAIFKGADLQTKPLRAARERAEAAKDTAEVKRVEQRMREIQNAARQRYKALQASP